MVAALCEGLTQPGVQSEALLQSYALYSWLKFRLQFRLQFQNQSRRHYHAAPHCH